MSSSVMIYYVFKVSVSCLAMGPVPQKMEYEYLNKYCLFFPLQSCFLLERNQAVFPFSGHVHASK